LIEGVRDGRKHNGAIWLASQHPNDFAISELADLLGSRFVFRQARQAIPAALQFLGIDDSVDAAAVLEQDMGSGQCLYRDVRDRVGLIQVLPPPLNDVASVFDTTPSAQAAVATAVPALPPTEPVSVLEPASDVERARPAAEEALAEPVDPAAADEPDPGPTDDRSSAVAEARSRARSRRRTPLARALAEPEDG
jgi:hypothetical protein